VRSRAKLSPWVPVLAIALQQHSEESFVVSARRCHCLRPSRNREYIVRFLGATRAHSANPRKLPVKLQRANSLIFAGDTVQFPEEVDKENRVDSAAGEQQTWRRQPMRLVAGCIINGLKGRRPIHAPPNTD
jgi:hypothetical protein